MDNLAARKRMSYSDKAMESENPAAKQLFTLMEEKKSNVILANDDLTFDKFLPLAERVGEQIPMIKTHVDILRYPRLSPGYKQEIIDAIRRDPEGAIMMLRELKPMEEYISEVIRELQSLSEEYGFMIFEDRKFADIGKIVKEQAVGGAFNIFDWAHFTNAHAISGPGIIDGLYESAKPHMERGEYRGLIMLAHMTPKGNLFTEEYAEKTIRFAEDQRDKETGENPRFVVGYIAGGSEPDKVRDWVAAKARPQDLIATPGVNLDPSEAELGQQYEGPKVVIASGSDGMIIGGGIYKQKDPAAAASIYRDIGWNTYKSVRNIG